MDYQVKLDVFQGPLDLLLHLIEKDEIDIYNIPIATITEKYLEYLSTIQQLNLEVAGEFLVMAATLMQIKAKMLLPELNQPGLSDAEADSDEDPRWELVCKLIEYKRIKEAALSLQGIEREQLKIYFRTAGEFPDQTYAVQDDSLKSLTVWDLMDAFRVVLESLEVKLLKSAIPKPQISIKQRMQEIEALVLREKQVSFKQVFANVDTKIGLITCFLAVLELIRLHKILAYQPVLFGDIYLTANEGEEKVCQSI